MWFGETLIAISTLLALLSYGDWMLCKAAPAPISKTINVNPSGQPGSYPTIQGAIDAGVPINNTQWILIQVAPGFYRNTTIVASDATYTLLNATLIAEANDFMAKHLTFKNTYNHQADGSMIRPAVAALVGGDRNSFYDCGFIGVQDTLYDRMGRHLFKNCYIEGSVDFIFGDATTSFENCNIEVNAAGVITAQNRISQDEGTGFVFKLGSVSGVGPTTLGRAYGPYSRVLYYKVQLSNNVAPEGWDAWNYKGHENDLTYAEEDCTGPGADTSRRVPWEKKLNNEELQRLIGPSFFNGDGWVEKQPNIP
ncbi:hypothetical protein L1049_021087 [Liquidambar formosana]|uniref:Pectinesterase n=1 Tax=Liquidambar formosana TaxID=63359 RepID=A0AAP0SDL7_LIQFO